MNLSAVQQRFIVHWGEMGNRWGINRTMAQIHALLYVTPEPLPAEQIQAALGVARSNVSNSLRELQSWGLVRRVHVFGDRRDHFECDKDVWGLFRRILDERKRREIDPTIAALRECVEASATSESPEVQDRLASMLELFELTDRWYSRVSRLPTGALIKFLEIGDRMIQRGSTQRRNDEVPPP